MMYTVQGRNQSIIDVKQRGALGDGKADDTRSIQQGIDAATPGTVVFLPKGIYRITSPLVLRSGIVLMGEGVRETATAMHADCTPAIKTVEPIRDVLISRIHIKGNRLDLNHLQNSIIDRITVGEVLLGPNSANCTIANSTIENVILDRCRDQRLSALYTRGVDINGGQGHRIQNCNIDLNKTRAAVKFTAPEEQETQDGNFLIRNCYFQLNDQHVISFDYPQPKQVKARIDGCIFRSNGTYRHTRADKRDDFGTEGVKMDIKTAIPEIYIHNAADIAIVNNMFDYLECLDPPGIRTTCFQVSGNADNLTIIGNKLRKENVVLPGSNSVMRCNVTLTNNK